MTSQHFLDTSYDNQVSSRSKKIFFIQKIIFQDDKEDMGHVMIENLKEEHNCSGTTAFDDSLNQTST